MLALILCASRSVTARVSMEGQSAARHSETYRAAAVDADGNLAITRSDGQIIVVRKEGEQTTFEGPQLSPDHTAAGAQAMFKNCCTSYDLPLQVVVYSDGKSHRFTGIELPIFQWDFAPGGRIAYGQEPAHFGCEIHYELRDIASARLVEQIDIPEPCGQRPDPKPVKMPGWVADLVARKR